MYLYGEKYEKEKNDVDVFLSLFILFALPLNKFAA